MEPLCRFAGRHLVKTALCHDQGHVEARHGANQIVLASWGSSAFCDALIPRRVRMTAAAE